MIPQKKSKLKEYKEKFQNHAPMSYQDVVKEILDFARLLRRNIDKQTKKRTLLGIALDSVIREYEEFTLTKCPECGYIHPTTVTKCPLCSYNYPAPHIVEMGGAIRDADGVWHPAHQSEPHPAPPTKCTWNDCMMAGFDREAAAQRAYYAAAGTTMVKWDSPLRDIWLRVVDAVLDVPRGRPNVADAAAGSSAPAPSPSLDPFCFEAKGDMEQARNVVSFLYYESELRNDYGTVLVWLFKYARALESALAAAQAELAKKRTLEERVKEKDFADWCDLVEENENLKAEVERLNGELERARQQRNDLQATLAKLKEPLTEEEAMDLRRLRVGCGNIVRSERDIFTDFLRLRGVES